MENKDAGKKTGLSCACLMQNTVQPSPLPGKNNEHGCHGKNSNTQNNDNSPIRQVVEINRVISDGTDKDLVAASECDQNEPPVPSDGRICVEQAYKAHQLTYSNAKNAKYEKRHAGYWQAQYVGGIFI